MIAIQYRKSVPRYLLVKALGRRWPKIYTSVISPVSLRHLPAPRLPTPEWVHVRPRLSGICGSDLATICAKGSPYLSPLTSTPFVLGHEVVGIVEDVGPQTEGVSTGDRVVLQPALGCAVRGIDPPCRACASGHFALCCNVIRGTISAGIQTGYCRDTGGGWSEQFVAHPSQLYRVPDGLPDALAVLTEPLACAVHGALRCFPGERDTVLVIGCGAIGLLTIAALRGLGCGARIIAVAKYAHQREHARDLGADTVLTHASQIRTRYELIAGSLHAEFHLPEIGKPTVTGGADVVFDCVASSDSIDDACRFTRAGGRLALVGMPAVPRGIDWTAIWYKELNIHAAYAYGIEAHDGRRRSTFEIALELLERLGNKLRPLVSKPHPLGDYREAIRAALHTGRSRSVKSVLAIQSRASGGSLT